MCSLIGYQKKLKKSRYCWGRPKCTLFQLQSDYNLKIKKFKTEIKQLHANLDEKQTTSEQLCERLNEIDTKLLRTKEQKQLYRDNVSLNVGIRHVEPVIRSVLKNIAGYEVDELPQPVMAHLNTDNTMDRFKYLQNLLKVETVLIH